MSNSYKIQNCLVHIYCSSIINEKHKEDAIKLKDLFLKINYTCEVFSDLSRAKFNRSLKELAKDQKLVNYGGLIIIIISNGYKNKIQCYDGNEIEFDQVINIFNNDNCKHLIGKPKMIIFNLNQKSKSLFSFQVKLNFDFFLVVYEEDKQMDFAPVADGGSVKAKLPTDISLQTSPTYGKKEQTMQLKMEPMELEMEQLMDIDEEKFHKENKFTDFITVCCTIEGENEFLILI